MNERPLNYLRWALISALAYMILLDGSGRTPAPSHLLYVAALMASNLVIPRVPYRNPQKFGSVLLAVDTLFVLIGVLLCDGFSQDLLIAYFLCVIMATFADSQRRIAGAAALVTGVYSFWLFQNLQAVNHASLLIRLPFLFITTVFYGYMMERVRGEHARRVHVEDEARGLDCLLRITRLFSASLVTADILQQASTILRSLLKVDRCSIHLLGDREPAIPAAAVSEALACRRPVLRHDADTGFPTALAVPIFHEREPLGALVLEQSHDGARFSPEAIEFCQVVANAAGPALHNARQHEALAEADRAKSHFLANLSHELRTPLNAILGFSELLGEDFDRAEGGDAREMIDRITSNAKRLLTHVENLLDLSTATLGQERRSIGAVDLPRMLDRVVAVAERARRDAVDVAVAIEPRIGEIYTDGEKLQRVLENVLSNAVKFTHQGSVSVCAKLLQKESPTDGTAAPQTAQRWEGLLSVSVKDTGIGMDPVEVGRALRGFHQRSGGPSGQYGGLGIGLAAARCLTSVMGGEIRVRSSRNHGAEFEVLVPVIVAA